MSESTSATPKPTTDWWIIVHNGPPGTASTRSGPFSSQESAERFAVGLSKSGRCTSVEIISKERVA